MAVVDHMKGDNHMTACYRMSEYFVQTKVNAVAGDQSDAQERVVVHH